MEGWLAKGDVEETEFLSVAPGSAASPGNLLEMQILTFRSRPLKSETLEVEPSNLCFNELSWNHTERYM